MKIFSLCVFGLIVWTLWTAAWAHSADGSKASSASYASDYNAIASDVAGKPVSVHCEFNADTWQTLVRSNFEPDPVSNNIAGFTSLNAQVVYLAPVICDSLRQADLFGAQNAGLVPFSLALLTLVHESVHQRGVTDESQTSCEAKNIVRSIAIRFYKIPERVWVYKYQKKGIRTYRRIRVQVANPVLTRFMEYVQIWHNGLPSSYRQGC